MKIKLDENLPDELGSLLAAGHHDVQTIRQELLTGRPDLAVFQAARAEHRVLFTQDLDFSDIRVFRPGTHPGLVLIRLHNPSRRRLIERMKQILSTEAINSWQGSFVVIGDAKLRVRGP
jgi:predicted nuclease of predicted toxin-antitoxin system